MKDVSIFIASSIREFQEERKQIAVYLEKLNYAYKQDGVRLNWYRPEIMPHALVNGGAQFPYDEKIRDCQFFVLLIGQEVGKHTEKEFNLALEQFQKSGKPVIIPCFLNVRASSEALALQARIREALEIDKQYVDTYDNLDQILEYLHLELIHGGAFKVASDYEQTASKGLDGIRELIREQQAKIRNLKAQKLTSQLIVELIASYEKIRRLVQTYKVEPDALLDYMDFLWKQGIYDKYDVGIELGLWLEGFYKMEPPGNPKLSKLENQLGLYYKNSGQHDEAERCYRKALEIRRRLAKKFPDTYEPELAEICCNMANLLSDMSRTKEAAGYYQEALEIYQRLSKENPVSDHKIHVADTYYNLGILKYRPFFPHAGIPLNQRNLGIFKYRQSDAEVARQYFEKALSLYENYPDTAGKARECRKKLFRLKSLKGRSIFGGT